MREVARRLAWIGGLAAALTWATPLAAQPTADPPRVELPSIDQSAPAIEQSRRELPRIEHGVELDCSLAIRPYVSDPLTGVRALASPGRFELRPVGEGATVQAQGDAWVVRAAAMRIEYEIVERATGHVVLRDRAELACGRALPPSDGAIELAPGRVFFGATMTQGPDDAGSCGGEGGPQQWYVIHLPVPAYLGLRLVSEFDATLYVREGAIDGPEVACRDRSARLETFDMHIAAGTYYVAVDGTRTHGQYRLIAFAEAADPRALDGVNHGELRASERVENELLPAVSRYHASCGGTQAPEHLYSIRIEHAARYSFRLASRFDSALYLLRADGAEIRCRSTLVGSYRWRESRVSVDLAPGIYWIVVDGESAAAGAGQYRLTALELPSPLPE